MFPVVLGQVCTHCSRDFGPLLHTGLLQIFQVLGLSLGNTEFQLPPYIFYGVQVWRLARPLQDLEMLLMEPLLSCPCCVFGVIVMLEDPAMTHLQCSYWGKEVVGQNLAIHGSIHPSLNTVQSSWSLCRKAPPKHDVSTPMLHGWDGVLGIVLILLHCKQYTCSCEFILMLITFTYKFIIIMLICYVSIKLSWQTYLLISCIVAYTELQHTHIKWLHLDTLCERSL